VARIVAGVATSHIPAVGAAWDNGKTDDPYWRPVFKGFERAKEWIAKVKPNVCIVARVPSGSILTLSLSFNNDGPLGSFFRYICDNGTYKAFYDDLSDGKDNKIDVSKVDVSMDGIELEDREFIAAIRGKREPNGSLAQVLSCMRVLGRLEKLIDPQRKAHA